MIFNANQPPFPGGNPTPQQHPQMRPPQPNPVGPQMHPHPPPPQPQQQQDNRDGQSQQSKIQFETYSWPFLLVQINVTCRLYPLSEPLKLPEEFYQNAPELKLYDKMLEYERIIDEEIARKRYEIPELIYRPPIKIRRVFRLHIFNEHFNQDTLLPSVILIIAAFSQTTINSFRNFHLPGSSESEADCSMTKDSSETLSLRKCPISYGSLR